jgi:hypothetical protein
MGLLRLLGKLAGIESKVAWTRSKKIEVVGPDFFDITITNWKIVVRS